MSWQEECIYIKWQGPPPLAGQEFFPQKQPLRLGDSRDDAQRRDVPASKINPAGNQNQSSNQV